MKNPIKSLTSIRKQLADKKRRIGDGMLSISEILVQGLQVLVPGAGAGISLALGKIFIGGILALICVGVVVRLTLRRKNADRVLAQRVSFPLKTIAFLLALGLSVGFVEMTNLPVRFNQPGFSFWYWAIVVAVIAVTYGWTEHIFLKAFSKKTKDVQVIRLG